MPRKKSVNKETVETVANTTFEVLPLLRKKLLRMDVVQAEHSMPMSHVQVLAMLGETCLVPDYEGISLPFFSVIRWSLGEAAEKVIAASGDKL